MQPEPLAGIKEPWLMTGAWSSPDHQHYLWSGNHYRAVSPGWVSLVGIAPQYYMHHMVGSNCSRALAQPSPVERLRKSGWLPSLVLCLFNPVPYGLSPLWPVRPAMPLLQIPAH